MNLSKCRDGYSVVSLARVDAEKRPFDAIEIARQAHERVPSLKFMWIGTGNLLEEARARARKHPYITFSGFLDETEKWRIIADASAFIFTSEREGFGTTMAQALLKEIPVIAYDLPVHRSVFGDTVVYVSCFDTRAFSNRLADVLLHPELYRDMTRKGRRLIESNYSANAFAERVERALYMLE